MEYRKFCRISEKEREDLVRIANEREEQLYAQALANGNLEEIQESVRENISILTIGFLNAKVPDEVTRDYTRHLYFELDETRKLRFYKIAKPKSKDNEELLKIMRAYCRWHAKEQTTEEE